MLSFAARGLKDSAVFVLGTYRDADFKSSPELSKSIGALSRHGSTIPLGGLSEAEVAELVEAKAGRPADRSLVKRLYQATDGNPLFVDGVVKLMLADGEIDRTRGADCDLRIPDGVRESIRQRLAALSERPYSILVTAAVIGNEFDVGLLQQVSGRKPEELVDLLKEAVDLGIVTNGERLGGSYRFSHTLIRGAIYEGLAAAERARVHRRIAEAVEALYGTDDNAHLDQLAYHFSQAPTPETVDKAINYSIRAGEAASQRYAYDRAGSYWRAALAMMSLANANPTRRAKVLGYLGSELFSAGPEAIAYLEEALPLFESLNKTCAVAEIHLGLGNLLLSPHLGCMDVRRAMEHLDKAETLAMDRAQLPFLYYLKGLACFRAMETTRGFELNRRAMDLSEQRGNEFFGIHTAMMDTVFLVALGVWPKLMLRAQGAGKSRPVGRRFYWLLRRLGGGGNSLLLLDPCAALSKFLAELRRPRTWRSRTRSAPLLEWSSVAYDGIGERRESRRARAQLRGSTRPRTRRGCSWDSEYSDFLAKIALARSNGDREAVCHLARTLEKCAGRAACMRESEAFLRESLDIASNAPHFPHALLTVLFLCVLYFDMCRRDDAYRSLAHCRSILAAGEDWKGIGGLAARAEAVVAALGQKLKDADAQFEKALDNFATTV